MKIHVCGDAAKPKVILLHPMLFCGKGMKMLLPDSMAEDYFFIIPDLSGHGEDETDFVSALSDAKFLKAYLVEWGYTDIYLLFGMSLGAVTALELYALGEIEYESVWLDGCSTYESSRVLVWILKKLFLKKHKKTLCDPIRTRKKMIEIYGENSGPFMAEGFLKISEKSVDNVVHACGFVHLPDLSPEESTKFTFEYGEKDMNRRRSERLITERYPKARFIIRRDCGHCQYLSQNPEAFAEIFGVSRKHMPRC
ncbi:alpha/beta fold hydrolase [Treponema phagedenis]|uniref:alpha/beta fold hydrolase n=1 Tax=Treponema phagedenis TaxID=162 RepID=UPI0001F6382B|nr:alpha/beta hydrolase [Treponema phagedenis]EFW36660.1 hypothetical protein HMPREF9554_02775 [Treponema phagedenis F0421]TYT79022.1 alpha/beta hydrolase [Treponema phagedenis]